MINIAGELKRLAESVAADVKEKGGVYTLTKTIAERKAFLSKKKLVYTAEISVDSQKKEISFSEYMKETGSGLSTGSDDFSPGFGFKAETYRTDTKQRTGTIEEQSNLFGAKYNYTFDFSKIRGQVEELASKAGYSVHYKLFQ